MPSNSVTNLQLHRDKEVITFTIIAFLKFAIITLIAFNLHCVSKAEKATKIHKSFPLS